MKIKTVKVAKIKKTTAIFIFVTFQLQIIASASKTILKTDAEKLKVKQDMLST